MTVNFAEFSATVPFVVNAQLPVLLRGRHGIGKSSVVYQFAAARGMAVVERRASQMTEGDLLGLPDASGKEINGEHASVFAPFEWLVRSCTEGVVLFLDEVDRAVTEVRQGLFELCDSRKIAGWTLHPDTIVFAAVNGGLHGAQYQVNAMDPAELDRYTVFDVEPTVEEWCDYASGPGNVDDSIVAFIRNHPTHLEHNGEFEPNKVYPSRRSWCRFNAATAKPGFLSDPKANRALISRLASAFLGLEASIAYVDFVVNFERQVSAADIIEKGMFDRVKDFTQTEHMSVVDSIIAGPYLRRKMTDVELQNFAEYVVTHLPAEAGMTLWTTVVVVDGVEQEVMTYNLTSLHKVKCSTGQTAMEWALEVIPSGDSA